MTEKNTGGLAFPDPIAVAPSGDVYPSNHSGMTLRDYFAGHALIGLISVNMSSPQSLDQAAHVPVRSAKWAYAVADAMIEARDK